MTRTTQDAYSLLPITFSNQNKELNGIFLGVFDGHGEYGGECSILCKEYV